MSARPTLDTLLTSPAIANKLPREVLSDLLAQNAAVQSILVAALVSNGAASAKTADPADDAKWITPAEAAIIIRKDVRWIYRHAASLPWCRRISRKSMLCSERVLRLWVEKQRVKP
jgi:hypothetical protein